MSYRARTILVWVIELAWAWLVRVIFKKQF